MQSLMGMLFACDFQQSTMITDLKEELLDMNLLKFTYHKPLKSTCLQAITSSPSLCSPIHCTKNTGSWTSYDIHTPTAPTINSLQNVSHISNRGKKTIKPIYHPKTTTATITTKRKSFPKPTKLIRLCYVLC